MKIKYADVIAKQLIENWADEFGFCAESQIAMHLEELFDVTCASIVSATESEECLLLQITTDRWEGAKEFALLPSGSLAW